ncbi:YjbF family lipoprotein [Pantoea sp. EABMAA-21]|uniref:YjbF family lipoprotein n=1 Tax=Pantoea sp. EABMAA-21 TaxID=3043302 RepID=UPI0024B615C0|nr:YjbF family lipoprotein [Pantoea sp. EABMAA-21]MDI9279608.1 YjbF family lipoprotein [Pantoea sp. EABMAA-21]
MHRLSLLLFCLLLQACTQTQKGLEQTVMLAVKGPDDVTVTDEQVASLPYASLYARINEGPRIFVVLGYDENGQLKWITQDKAMLVMQHGRLVKTLGLASNLDEVSNLAQDPLVDALHLQNNVSWTRVVQWREKEKVRAATATSTFQRGDDTVLNIAGERVPCRIWIETVRMDDVGAEWQNTFWIDNRDGSVLQANQMLAADAFPVETTILKPAKS